MLAHRCTTWIVVTPNGLCCVTPIANSAPDLQWSMVVPSTVAAVALVARDILRVWLGFPGVGPKCGRPAARITTIRGLPAHRCSVSAAGQSGRGANRGGRLPTNVLHHLSAPSVGRCGNAAPHAGSGLTFVPPPCHWPAPCQSTLPPPGRCRGVACD